MGYIPPRPSPLAMGYQPGSQHGYWKEWYAWFPTRMKDGKWIWLKKIYRKTIPYTYDNDYEFGTLFDMLKDIETNKSDGKPIPPPPRIVRY